MNRGHSPESKLNMARFNNYDQDTLKFFNFSAAEKTDKVPSTFHSLSKTPGTEIKPSLPLKTTSVHQMCNAERTHPQAHQFYGQYFL